MKKGISEEGDEVQAGFLLTLLRGGLDFRGHLTGIFTHPPEHSGIPHANHE